MATTSRCCTRAGCSPTARCRSSTPAASRWCRPSCGRREEVDVESGAPGWHRRFRPRRPVAVHDRPLHDRRPPDGVCEEGHHRDGVQEDHGPAAGRDRPGVRRQGRRDHEDRPASHARRQVSCRIRNHRSAASAGAPGLARLDRNRGARRRQLSRRRQRHRCLAGGAGWRHDSEQGTVRDRRAPAADGRHDREGEHHHSDREHRHRGVEGGRPARGGLGSGHHRSRAYADDRRQRRPQGDGGQRREALRRRRPDHRNGPQRRRVARQAGERRRAVRANDQRRQTGRRDRRRGASGGRAGEEHARRIPVQGRSSRRHGRQPEADDGRCAEGDVGVRREHGSAQAQLPGARLLQGPRLLQPRRDLAGGLSPGGADSGRPGSDLAQLAQSGGAVRADARTAARRAPDQGWSSAARRGD